MSSTGFSTGSDDSFSTVIIDGVRAGMRAAAHGDRTTLTSALRAMCDEAHRRAYPPERIAISLKRAWRATACPALVGPIDWDEVYNGALASALGIYYDRLRSPAPREQSTRATL